VLGGGGELYGVPLNLENTIVYLQLENN